MLQACRPEQLRGGGSCSLCPQMRENPIVGVRRLVPRAGMPLKHGQKTASSRGQSQSDSMTSVVPSEPLLLACLLAHTLICEMFRLVSSSALRGARRC